MTAELLRATEEYQSKILEKSSEVSRLEAEATHLNAIIHQQSLQLHVLETDEKELSAQEALLEVELTRLKAKLQAPPSPSSSSAHMHQNHFLLLRRMRMDTAALECMLHSTIENGNARIMTRYKNAADSIREEVSFCHDVPARLQRAKSSLENAESLLQCSTTNLSKTETEIQQTQATILDTKSKLNTITTHNAAVQEKFTAVIKKIAEFSSQRDIHVQNAVEIRKTSAQAGEEVMKLESLIAQARMELSRKESAAARSGLNGGGGKR